MEDRFTLAQIFRVLAQMITHSGESVEEEAVHFMDRKQRLRGRTQGPGTDFKNISLVTHLLYLSYISENFQNFFTHRSCWGLSVQYVSCGEIFYSSIADTEMAMLIMLVHIFIFL